MSRKNRANKYNKNHGVGRGLHDFIVNPFKGHGFGFEDREDASFDGLVDEGYSVDADGFYSAILNEKENLSISNPDVNHSDHLGDKGQRDKFYPSHLFLLEPEDASELSLSDLEVVWEHRKTLCGSIEAAAEVLALIEVSRGAVKEYSSWQNYINHPDIKDLRELIPILDEIDSNESKLAGDLKCTYGNKIKALDREDVLRLELSEVDQAWKMRPYSFKTVSAACTALAILRVGSKADVSIRSWTEFIYHESIKELYDYVQNDFVDVEDAKADSLCLLEIDTRKKVVSEIVEREGQSAFREQLISRYGCCCFTGTIEMSVMEAAHILPYKGLHTNLLENGLLMRVDFHRLFDRYLISVNPANLVVCISVHVSDDYYRSFDGRLAFGSFNKKTAELLGEHYKLFLENQKKDFTGVNL